MPVVDVPCPGCGARLKAPPGADGKKVKCNKCGLKFRLPDPLPVAAGVVPGAAPSDEGPVVIPGSRGSLSYLVLPMGDGADHAHSLAHGAGRKWTRTSARERMRERFSPEALTRTSFKSHVICEDRDLLFEEAPPAYKAIDRVVGDLVDAGLVRVVATLAPVLTYKTRSARE